jgi:hypothetical protein
MRTSDDDGKVPDATDTDRWSYGNGYLGGTGIQEYSWRLYQNADGGARWGVGDTMYSYVGNSLDVYRCPADSMQDAWGIPGTIRSSYFHRHVIEGYCGTFQKALREVRVKRPSATTCVIEEAWHNPAGNYRLFDPSGTDAIRPVNAVFYDGHCSKLDIPRQTVTTAGAYDANWHIYSHPWDFDGHDPHDVE